MAVQDYSTDPNQNTTISGINIGEGMPPANVNNAMRQMMADIRVFYNGIPVTDIFATKDAAVFEGTQPKYTGRGAMLHHNDPNNTSARVFILAEGSPNPTSPANGDIVCFNTP